MLVPGKVEKIIIILDIGGDGFAAPILIDYRKIVSKIATAYMHRAHKIIVINPGCFIHVLYKSSRKQL